MLGSEPGPKRQRERHGRQAAEHEWPQARRASTFAAQVARPRVLGAVETAAVAAPAPGDPLAHVTRGRLISLRLLRSPPRILHRPSQQHRTDPLGPRIPRPNAALAAHAVLVPVLRAEQL